MTFLSLTLEKNGNFKFSCSQTPKYWQRGLLTGLEVALRFVVFKVQVSTLYIIYAEKYHEGLCSEKSY